MALHLKYEPVRAFLLHQSPLPSLDTLLKNLFLKRLIWGWFRHLPTMFPLLLKHCLRSLALETFSVKTIVRTVINSPPSLRWNVVTIINTDTLFAIIQLNPFGLVKLLSCQVQDPATRMNLGTSRKVGRLFDLVTLHLLEKTISTFTTL